MEMVLMKDNNQDNQHKVVPLSSLPEGTVIKLEDNGEIVEYYVCKHYVDEEKTLLFKKQLY